jgi:hypothetical protein
VAFLFDRISISTRPFFLLVTGLAQGDLPAMDHEAVKAGDRSDCLGVNRHFNKTEAFAFAGIFIGDQFDGSDLPELGQ